MAPSVNAGCYSLLKAWRKKLFSFVSLRFFIRHEFSKKIQQQLNALFPFFNPRSYYG